MDLKEGCEIRCPGCAHRALSAGESQAQKENWLKTKLSTWQNSVTPLRAVNEKNRWNYREKLCLTTVWRETGWQFGLVARNELIAIPRCPVHSERSRQTIDLLSRILPPAVAFPMAFYVQSGAQITLILKTHDLPCLTWLNGYLKQDLETVGIEGLWLHLHPAAGRRLFAKKGWHLLWGQPRSRNDQGLAYGPSAFQQVIPVLYKEALDEAETFLDPSPATPIVDLYCGTGTSLSRWTRRGAKTVGVELGGEAVECARLNAPEALVLRGKGKDRLAQLKSWIGSAFGRHLSLYVNPPRTGIESEVLNWITDEFRPWKIAYLSCSAGTLRRDLESLNQAGYRIERITPYDFFPQTYHVETLALLQRGDFSLGCVMD